MTSPIEPREYVFRTDVPALAPAGRFEELCRSFGIELDQGDAERLGRFLAILLEANRIVNLTSITDPGGAWERHIFDSLTLLSVLGELGDDASVADVGSGGGLPGIPLAVCLPATRFMLMEATGKKARFIEAAAGALGMSNISVIGDRAESAGQDPLHRGRYEAVTARALGRIAVAAELTIPLARVGGRILLVKGEKADEELAEAKKALHMLHAAHAGTIDTPTGRIVVLEKLRDTPGAYPRRPGEPKRHPLGA